MTTAVNVRYIVDDVDGVLSLSLMSKETGGCMNYEGRIFRSVTNTAGGDVGEETRFHYHQEGVVVWATYSGGAIVFGTLLAKADEAGVLDMRYQHLTVDGSFRAGRCHSLPEVLPDGRVRVHERWQWTAGAEGDGVSTIEEVA